MLEDVLLEHTLCEDTLAGRIHRPLPGTFFSPACVIALSPRFLDFISGAHDLSPDYS